MTQKIRIGERLVQYGYINEEQLENSLSLQKGTRKKIGEILVEQGLIAPEILINVLKEHLNVNSIELTPSNIEQEATTKLPQNICKRYKVFPYNIDENKLYLAMEDTQNMEAIQDVRRLTGMEVVVSIATISDINQAIQQYYSSTDIDAAINEYAKNDVKNEPEDEITGEEDLNSAPIVRLVHGILESAVRQKASDIHIEHSGNYMRVRFRIDGILVEHMKTSPKAYKAVISRIKIMADLNISEKRLPQDGRIYLTVDNKSVDFRVSTMPTSTDEKVVMRVLDKSSFMVSKEKLGFSNESIKIYDELLQKPYGLILVVGPTGSGKTTTLYSMLNQLNDIEKNILTIEDPVEYELPGINQSQINYKAGLDFASALRAFLRQDPDIIMVGEIRDHDTAEIAIRASLTGHLVLSTLHANTAIGAISRLSDMGMDSFLITSSLMGVIAQRLVRRVCPLCKEEYQASIGEKKALGYDLDKDLTLYKGKGCDKCNNTGYKGRLGLYEMIQISKPIRDLIDQGAKEEVIMKKANELGMKSMRQDAAAKAIQGLTTVEEMLRVTFISD